MTSTWDEEDTNTAEDWYNIGRIAFSEKNYDEALEHYTKAIELKPDYYDAYYNRGDIKYVYKQDYDGAIADFDKAIEFNPDLVQAYINCAMIKINQEKFDDANEYLNKASKFKLDDKQTQIVNIARSSILGVTKIDDLGVKLKKLNYDVKKLKYKSVFDWYMKQSMLQFSTFIILRLFEAFIYYNIAVFLYNGGFTWFESLLNEKNTVKMIFLLCFKIGILIPVYLLVRLIHTTATRFSVRAELDRDTGIQWEFFDRTKEELKNLKDNTVYVELYKKLLEEHITIVQKTNFERIEDIYNNRHNKSVSLKQIDALAETAKKIKDVCITPKEQDEKKEDAKNP